MQPSPHLNQSMRNRPIGVSAALAVGRLGRGDGSLKGLTSPKPNADGGDGGRRAGRRLTSYGPGDPSLRTTSSPFLIPETPGLRESTNKSMGMSLPKSEDAIPEMMPAKKDHKEQLSELLIDLATRCIIHILVC